MEVKFNFQGLPYMYRLPTFNLKCDIFTFGTWPAGPARLTNVDCNLAWGKRVNVASTGGTFIVGVPLMAMSILFPAGTDVRGPVSAGGADVVEVPAGSGRGYLIAFCDDIGKGFPNGHRAAIGQQQAPWPTPDP